MFVPLECHKRINICVDLVIVFIACIELVAVTVHVCSDSTDSLEVDGRFLRVGKNGSHVSL